MLEFEKIREKFSIYKNYEQEFESPLVYLDSASTSLTPDCVVKTMSDYYTNYRSNIERSSFVLSAKAENEVLKVRSLVADFIEAEDKDTIIFTSGATDSANKIIDMVLSSLEKGSTVLTSLIEHHSIYVTLDKKCKKLGISLQYMDVDLEGQIDYKALKRVFSEGKIGAVFTQLVNNVNGQIIDVKKIKNLINNKDTLLVCDASQAVGHLPVSVSELGVDALFFSGHKMCGPTGIGILYVKKDLLQKLEPATYGGGAVQKVSSQLMVYREGGKRFEPGTANISGIIGLGGAISFIQEIGLENIRIHVDELFEYATKQLKKIDNIKIYSKEKSVGIISFSVDNIHAHDIEYLLAENGIATRSGYHCAESFTRYISNVPLTRVSLYLYNTKEDIDKLILEINSISKKFSK